VSLTRRIWIALALSLTAGLALLPQAGAVYDPTVTRNVVLFDRAFKCNDYPQPLDLDLVKVTLTENYDRAFSHAVALRGKCTGRIGRIEVETTIGDGVMVGKGAQSLTIQSGYVRCFSRRLAEERRNDLHQDGVQALGGVDVTFRGVEIDCPSANNAAFFLTRGAGGADTPTVGDWPTRVVCDGCTFSAPAQLVSIHASISSGARNSFFACKPKLTKVRVTDAAVDPVNENNTLLSLEPCDKLDVSR
jgi:hypothetical protein